MISPSHPMKGPRVRRPTQHTGPVSVHVHEFSRLVQRRLPRGVSDYTGKDEELCSINPRYTG